jgi:hypothetical protein
VSKADDFHLKREVSIYSIGDLLKETVANETLTDDRDRKYFIVTQKKKCCKPPPIFVPGISIVQVTFVSPTSLVYLVCFPNTNQTIVCSDS